MTSDPEKVPTGDVPGNEEEGWTIGGRADREEIRLIDIASAIAGEKRGPWMIRVCVEEAKRVIEEHSRAVVQAPAA